jgi:hypothetical protein
MDLTGFLTARLADDEAAAKASYHDDQRWITGEEGACLYPGEEVRANADRAADARHIARHDPGRVLREVAAKRAILDLADKATGLDEQVDQEFGVGLRDEVAEPMIGDLILRALAAVYADHPDYDPAWG